MKTLAFVTLTLGIIWIRRRKRPDPDLVKLAGEVGGWWEEALPG